MSGVMVAPMEDRACARVAGSGLVLQARDVCYSYRRGSAEIQALSGVNLAVRPGELAVVVGPAGSGKSTLLHLAGCLDRPSRGSLQILGMDVAVLPEKQLIGFRRDVIGVVHQLLHLFPTLTVRANVELPLTFSGREHPDRVDALLRALHLEGQQDKLPVHLDLGTLQRVALARALVNQPRMLLVDDPPSKLESDSREIILDVLHDLRREGMALLVATQDVSLAERADRVLELKGGRMVLDRWPDPALP